MRDSRNRVPAQDSAALQIQEGARNGRSTAERQQKRVAKQKAKKSAREPRSQLRRGSSDPTVACARRKNGRSFRGARGRATRTRASVTFSTIARRDSRRNARLRRVSRGRRLPGSQNVLWQTGTKHDYKELVDRLETMMTMRTVTPAYLANKVTGAVDWHRNLWLLASPRLPSRLEASRRHRRVGLP